MTKYIPKNNMALAVLYAVLAVSLSSCGGGGGTSYGSGGYTSMPAPPAPSGASTVQVVACPAGGTTDVSIVSMIAGFSPASISVPVNTTVRWTNNDTITHTVTSTSVPANGTFDSTVTAGTSVCMKFSTGGTFNYHCSIHPSTMIGVVTVQ